MIEASVKSAVNGTPRAVTRCLCNRHHGGQFVREALIASPLARGLLFMRKAQSAPWPRRGVLLFHDKSANRVNIVNLLYNVACA